MSTYVPGFLSFSMFFASFCIGQFSQQKHKGSVQELNAGTVGVLIRALTCDNMLVEIVELVGLLHRFDGLVVDMPQPRQSIIQPVVCA